MSYLFISSFIWAFSYGLMKTELTSLDPNFVASCRMLSAFLVFLPFLVIKKNKKEAPFLLLLGGIQYGLMYLLVLQSYQYLEAYQVVLFTAMTPFYVILFNTLFERRFCAYHYVVVAMAIIGGWIIYSVESMKSDILWGFCLVQAADLCFSFGQIAYIKFRKMKPAIEDKEIYGFLFLGALLISIFSTTWVGDWNSIFDITLRQGFALVYLGVISSGCCFFWWNKGATQMHPLMLSVFNNLKLPLATLVSVVFFHEHVKQGWRLGFGLLIMVLALFLADRHQRRQA